jgi:hypothetical protein
MKRSIAKAVGNVRGRRVRAVARQSRDDTPRGTSGRFAGFRRGLAAAALYLVFVGVGHVALAMYWYDQTTGMRRDGQAFSGTMVLAIGVLLLGIMAAPFAIAAERDRGAVGRGALVALAVATVMVGLTVIRGYETEPYIADSRANWALILTATVAAYAFAHIISQRIRPRRPDR